jgi:hypothetical protein
MIVIDEKFLVIKEINGYLVDMILINSFRSGLASNELLEKEAPSHHFLIDRRARASTEPAELLLRLHKKCSKSLTVV